MRETENEAQIFSSNINFKLFIFLNLYMYKHVCWLVHYMEDKKSGPQHSRLLQKPAMRWLVENIWTINWVPKWQRKRLEILLGLGAVGERGYWPCEPEHRLMVKHLFYRLAAIGR